MEQTVNALNGEVDKAKAYVERERGRLSTTSAPAAVSAGDKPGGLARIL
jgi:hypothetical protein